MPIELSSANEASLLLQKLMSEFEAPPMKQSVRDCPSAKELLQASTAQQVLLIEVALKVLQKSGRYYDRACAEEVMEICLKQIANYTELESYNAINMLVWAKDIYNAAGTAATLLGEHFKKYGSNDEVNAMARRLLKRLDSNPSAASSIKSLLMNDKKFAFNELIPPQEAWSDLARAEMESMSAQRRESWLNLLAHSKSCSSTKPSKKWNEGARKYLDAVGAEEYRAAVSRWFAQVGKPGTSRKESVLICAPNTDLLKGLVWFCTLTPTDETMQMLGALADVCFKKIPEHGALSPKIANACVGALSAVTTQEAIAQLSRLQAKSKKPSARAQIEKALQGAADKSGLSVDEMQEINVPNYGFSEIGKNTIQLGEHQVQITIGRSGEIELGYLSNAGKATASAPAALKSGFAAELKALKANVQAIEKLLPAIRYRVESSLLEQRHWTFEAWCKRYHEHPIAATLSRRLIWSFNGKAAIWDQDHFIDLDGNEVEVADSMLVELWHPIAADPPTIGRWRRLLSEKGITQPFKQAHRELYILTDAERETATYSNRFAAHIINQHQFANLAQQRGWRYTLQGAWDSHNTPVRELPRWDLAVEFWVDAVGAGEAASVTDAGIFRYVSTDQVRFCRRGECIPLAEVIPIVFSEVMREVDLFVGVASIGNDPEWADRGADGHNAYWQSYSFGELGNSAQTRKQVLAEIIPCLKIADRCKITDKFLVVRGDLRTYKIHFASGNILMEPNDQYLCIVEGRSSKGANPVVTLPFEGDLTLSIILSKAFLLSADSKITDPSIVRQIKY